MSIKRFPYGGQAVLEGVMMRGLRQATVAVRHPSGEIVFKHELLNVQRRHAWENLPFLRGVLMLWDALNLGTRALNFSASVAISAEEDAQAGGEAVQTAIRHDDHCHDDRLAAVRDRPVLRLPTLLASLADRFGATSLVREGSEEPDFSWAYSSAILSRSAGCPRLARLFGFHGAEHKTINAYEAGAPLTVDRCVSSR